MLGMCIAVRLIVPPIVAAAHTGTIDAVAEACGSIKWADFVSIAVNFYGPAVDAVWLAG